MKTGLFGQQLTLMEELKAGTFAAHARLQSAPFFGALAGCQLPLESYVGQLRALAIIYAALERVLTGCQEERVASVWTRDMRKLPWLQTDLRYFEPRAVADLKDAVDAALKIADQIHALAAAQPLSLLGGIYVLEGSTLGAGVLRPLVARAFLLTGDEGLAYLHGYGAAVHDRWAQFQQRMNGLQLAAGEADQMVQAANEFFHQLESVFRALFPFLPAAKTFLVTSINPEAGRHAVPADDRELAAALRAGDRCWDRFPYLEQRYGERGRRFARSDVAWQATLCQFEPGQISQQVRWLGRLLAGRGMPTLLLAVQLEILVGELSAARPEKKSGYEKLLPAVAELHAARSRQLTDAQLQALATEFDLAVGLDWSRRLPQTGHLLGWAVADEGSGSDLAVESLRRWLTDRARFPDLWIQAVETTIAQARALVPLPKATH